VPEFVNAPNGSLANSGGGAVLQQGAFNNRIGPTSSDDARNTPWENIGAGIRLQSDAGTNNTFQYNRIFDTDGLGIDLEPVGVNANDSEDPDTGPNNLQNWPVMTSAVMNGTILDITGSLNSEPNTLFVIDYYRT